MRTLRPTVVRRSGSPKVRPNASPFLWLLVQGWLLAACGASFSQASPAEIDGNHLRQRISLDADWRFQKGDPVGVGDEFSYAKSRQAILASSDDAAIEAAADTEFGHDVPCTQIDFDDGGWRDVDVPHDWGIEGPFDQALPGATGKLPWAGAGWYRKHFKLPASADPQRRVSLDVDGAMAYSEIWCNGQFVGGWPYGYTSFALDLTRFVHADAENVLAIRLQNPPDSSRWYPGSGLYRHVWLTETAPLHVAHWGTRITTPEADAESATIRIATVLENSGAARDASIQIEIFALGSDGRPTDPRVAVTQEAAAKLPAHEQQTVETTAKVTQPKLWAPDHPSLYVAITTVRDGERAVDQCETTFGIRTVRFTANAGFLLNGQRVPIHGVCLHHDLGALGAAFNLQAAERQFAQLKAMGCNAFRTSHNPPAPELLDLCDRLGILVLDEAFDCWQTGKTPNDYHLLFDDWGEKDLRAMIRRDHNHPSVVLWSIGNEVPDQLTPQGPALATKLTRIAHEEDPTRLTTTACDKIGSGYNDFHQGVDVFGYNYKPEEYQKFHAANPGQPLLGTETSSGYNSRGAYFFPVTDDRRGGLANDQVSSDDLYYDYWATGAEREFRGEDDAPFVSGGFVWTGFDYLGEPTPYDNNLKGPLRFTDPVRQAREDARFKETGKLELPSRSSYFGIMDLAGFPKDGFYLYQSQWRPDLPMAHLLPHWTWPERAGEITPVHVYTSGEEAELFLNDRSLGRKKKGPGEYRLRWDDVKYAPGELKVIAYKAGQLWATDQVQTAGDPAKLALQAEASEPRGDDAADLVYVDANITDASGQRVPRADQTVHFRVLGPADLVATDNGDATDHTPFSSAERRAFNGRCLAVVRLRPGAKGAVQIHAQADGVLDAALCLRAH